MKGDADIASVAALMADPTRARILAELTDGRALPPSELAQVAGVARSTVSEHLAKLERGGFVAVEKGGRNRYFRLSGPEVAGAVEALAAIAPRLPVSSLREARRAGALGDARTCYGHLAGRLGVAITDAMQDQGAIERDGDIFLLSGRGARQLRELGIERPPPAGKACNDWSERRPHIAGRLGVTLARRLFDLRWIERTPVRRAVSLTPAGRVGLQRDLGVALDPP